MLSVKDIQKWLPKKKIHLIEKDRYAKTSIPYYLMAIITSLALLADGVNPFMFLAIVYSFFPILDELFIIDNSNPTLKEKKELIEQQKYFVAPVYTAMIISWIVQVKIFSIIYQIDIAWNNFHYLIALMFIVSNLYSIQFITAHELMHKPGNFNRILGTIHMISLFYSHLTIDHLYNHHKLVAIYDDPSTSRKGESLYKFLPRMAYGTWKGAYDHQKQNGKNFFTNYANISLVASFSFAVAIYLIWGLQVAIAHVLMAVGAIIYLQTISYIQHYGLERKLLPNGEYEKVTIMHSWNASQTFTNYFLFNLQRHSDHHENSSTPYQALASLQDSPFLPHCYTLMVLMAFFPETWFRIVDPLLEAYQEVVQGKRAKVSRQAVDLAVTETRKFLIKVVLGSMLMFAASVFKLI